MMSVGKIANSNYYSELASEDYYNKDGEGKEPPGIWFGEGAAQLGLIHGQCHVNKKDFAMVAQGFNPNDGAALMRSAGRAGKNGHVVGHDLCFSSPKSVSLLKYLGDDETAKQVRDAELMAVRETLSYVESIVQVRKSSKENEPAKGCFIPIYEHSTARAVDDEMPDPQSHYHCLLLNVALRSDGKYGGIDYRNIYQQKAFLGALYRANLATNLKCAGFEIERDRGVFFRIAGVPKELEQHYSKRSEQIESAIQRDKSITNKGSAAVRAVATKNSRSAKGEFNRDDWQKNIRQEAKDKFGFDQTSIKKLREHSRVKVTARSDASILRSLAKFDKSFQEKDVMKLLAIDGQFSGDSGVEDMQKRCKQILGSQHVSSQTNAVKDRFGREEKLTLYQYSAPAQQHFHRAFVPKPVAAAPAGEKGAAPAAGGAGGSSGGGSAHSTQGKINELRAQLIDLVKAKAAIPIGGSAQQVVANGTAAVELAKSISDVEAAIKQLEGAARAAAYEHQQE